MRYKIHSPRGADQYGQVLDLLRERRVDILVKNDRRRMVAVGDFSDEVRGELDRLGASVAEDVQYAPE
jgi:hypothetical protein